MEIVVNIEKDNILMWIQDSAAVDANKGRVIITKLILWVPKLELTDLGKKNYYNRIINPEKWIFNKLVMNIKEILHQLKEYLILQMQLQNLDM